MRNNLGLKAEENAGKYDLEIWLKLLEDTHRVAQKLKKRKKNLKRNDKENKYNTTLEFEHVCKSVVFLMMILESEEEKKITRCIIFRRLHQMQIYFTYKCHWQLLSLNSGVFLPDDDPLTLRKRGKLPNFYSLKRLPCISSDEALSDSVQDGRESEKDVCTQWGQSH